MSTTKVDDRVSVSREALLDNQRLGPGSTIQTRAVTVRDDSVKTFAFRDIRVGSWYIDVDPFAGTFYKYAAGTVPPGSVKPASFTEAFDRARARYTRRAGSRGSVSIFYIGYSP